MGYGNVLKAQSSQDVQRPSLSQAGAQALGKRQAYHDQDDEDFEDSDNENPQSMPQKRAAVAADSER